MRAGASPAAPSVAMATPVAKGIATQVSRGIATPRPTKVIPWLRGRAMAHAIRAAVPLLAIRAAVGGAAVIQQRPIRSGPNNTSSELVGLVTETREEHLHRHGGGMRSCPRCRWYKLGPRWVASYGYLESCRAGPRERTVWISERPIRWGGTWALGCAICADAALRRSQQQSGAPGDVAKSGVRVRRRLGTHWARYEVRPLALQAEHVKQHAHYDLHKVAVAAFLRPDEPVRFAMQATLDDDRLLHGAVPQPADWLRAWRAARTPQSWQAAAKAAQTEHFAHQVRPRAVQPRTIQSMALIQREVIRERKRSWIRECSSISLRFDDRNGYKLVRFQCDAPASARLEILARRGILGCVDCLRAVTLTDLAEDYAERTSREVVRLVRLFCTPLSDVVDEGLCDKFLKSVKAIVADGALQKTGLLCKLRAMLNVVLVLRDPCHMIRIAVQEPLIRTGNFEKQHRRLFQDKHALIKDLQNSRLWQGRLEHCQRHIVRMDGCQGGRVKHIMRHFCFAPQRFESFADPRRKYACTLVAVALMLADMAGDMRLKPEQRARAEESLEDMTPRHILEAGLSGDFGEVAMRCQALCSMLVSQHAHACGRV